MELCLHRRGHLWKNGQPLSEEQKRMVESNMGLAYDWVRRKPISCIDQDENVSEALFCLARAAGNFNPSLGWQFSTFAWSVWLNHRKDAFRERTLEVRGHQVGKCRLGQEDQEHMEPIDYRENAIETLEDREEYDQKMQCLSVLDSRGRQVLEMRAQGMTLSAIGTALCITRERVRQLEKRAIFTIQHSLGLALSTDDPLIKELHDVKMQQIEYQKKYLAKIQSIRATRAAHPIWNARKIAEVLGISETMVRRHGRFARKPVKCA